MVFFKFEITAFKWRIFKSKLAKFLTVTPPLDWYKLSLFLRYITQTTLSVQVCIINVILYVIKRHSCLIFEKIMIKKQKKTFLCLQTRSLFDSNLLNWTHIFGKYRPVNKLCARAQMNSTNDGFVCPSKEKKIVQPYGNTRTWTHTYTHSKAYEHTYTHTHTWTHTHVNTHIRTLAHTHTHTHIYTDTHTMHTNTHTQTHISTHTYTHMNTQCLEKKSSKWRGK